MKNRNEITWATSWHATPLTPVDLNQCYQLDKDIPQNDFSAKIDLQC